MIISQITALQDLIFNKRSIQNVKGLIPFSEFPCSEGSQGSQESVAGVEQSIFSYLFLSSVQLRSYILACTGNNNFIENIIW